MNALTRGITVASSRDLSQRLLAANRLVLTIEEIGLGAVVVPV